MTDGRLLSSTHLDSHDTASDADAVPDTAHRIADVDNNYTF